jgi:hypothetical protein
MVLERGGTEALKSMASSQYSKIATRPGAAAVAAS